MFNSIRPDLSIRKLMQVIDYALNKREEEKKEVPIQNLYLGELTLHYSPEIVSKMLENFKKCNKLKVSVVKSHNKSIYYYSRFPGKRE